ncbi:uncharacterized protein LOC128127885 [Lactuca sativa]|uniref:uncharacterized protein LOC128127885 n=1 Tax=Lactuca sativa TaxID=4236 RepID=UPI0022AEBDD3|nr:uncharacterized protein LOC128127885 [Lactuca sativa]
MITLKRWTENVESVFEICECPEEVKVKFAACTFVDQALTWWNGHVEAMTLPVANAMPWAELKEMLMAEYCPHGGIQKMEQELWNLTVRNTDINAYITRFSELSLLCPDMITSEGKKIEGLVWGLTSPIQGNMIPANPETFDGTKSLAKKLYDHNNKMGEKLGETEGKKEIDNKKGKNNKRKGGQGSESSKKQQTATVHAVTTQVPSTPHAPVSSTPSAPKKYFGNLPKCNKCNSHHNGECREMHCTSWNRKAHTAK